LVVNQAIKFFLVTTQKNLVIAKKIKSSNQQWFNFHHQSNNQKFPIIAQKFSIIAHNVLVMALNFFFIVASYDN